MLRAACVVYTNVVDLAACIYVAGITRCECFQVLVLYVICALHVLLTVRLVFTRCDVCDAGVDGFVVAARDMYVASLVSVVGIVSDT